MNNKTVGIIGGIPGAGKTTIAFGLRNKNFSVYDIDEMFPDLKGEAKWKEFQKQFQQLILEGKEGIFVGSFMLPQTRKDFFKFAQEHGYKPAGLFFNLKPEDVKNRIARRSQENPNHPMSIEGNNQEAVTRWHNGFQSQVNDDLKDPRWTVIEDPEADPQKIAEDIENKLNTKTELRKEGHPLEDLEPARK